MKFNFKNLALLSALGGVFLLGCKEEKKAEEMETAQVEVLPGINTEYMDTSVKPSEDFFRFVNGKWLDTNEIPEDRTVWGSFNELRKKTDDDALAILKEAMSNDKDLKGIQVVPGSDQEKAVFYYQTIMDTVGRNKAGLEPVKHCLFLI